MCSSGQRTGGLASCGSQAEEGWNCHLEERVCFVDAKALVEPMKRLLDWQ